jgi:hypothetical protein
VLVTGGFNSGQRSTTEVYGSTCSVPALPEPRSTHVTFLTPDGIVAICGGTGMVHGAGRPLLTCLVLAPGSSWQEERLGSLGMVRESAAVTTLPGATFILGGRSDAAYRSSEVLLHREDSWTAGPRLPIDMYAGCSVRISDSQLLAINKGKIAEFDMSVAGPLSTAGWRPAGTGPDLATRRSYHGCAATGGRVVVAGGGYGDGTGLKTTEVIDNTTHRVTAGPEMLDARGNLQLAVLPAPGGAGARVLALGGKDSAKDFWDGQILGSVEEWLPGPGGTSTWRHLAPLQSRAFDIGAVAISAGLVCPS